MSKRKPHYDPNQLILPLYLPRPQSQSMNSIGEVIRTLPYAYWFADVKY